MMRINREKEIDIVTLAGSAVNVLPTAVKFTAGILGRSSAMLADAVHVEPVKPFPKF